MTTSAFSRFFEWFKSDCAMSTETVVPAKLAMTSDKRCESAGATPSKGSSKSSQRVPIDKARAKATSFC